MPIIRVLLIAAWFLLAMISLAHADPITAAITTIATTIGQLGVAAKLVLGIALEVGGSLLSRALAKKRDTPQSGIKTDVASGGNNSLAFIVGTYATAGSHEYVGSWGSAGKTPNAYLTQVRSLSDLPIAGVGNRIWINSEACTIDYSDTSYGTQGFPVNEFKTNGNDNHLWVKPLTGNQIAADPFLLSKFGTDPDRPWLNDMIGRGVAMAIFTAQYDRELFTSTPSPIFEVQGIPLYDPRKDSTVGGSGSHRWGQPGTYEFSDNNVVIIYNIMRGIYYAGTLIYGPAVPAARLPLSNWFAAMNECDRLINLDGGGTERQFRAGYEIETSNKQPVDIIDDILLGCNGRMAEIGGVYKIHVGAPALPVYFFTDDDIIVTDGQSLDPFPGYENTYNGASASYPEPETGWQMKDAPQYSDASFLAADGGEIRLASLEFNATPFPVQVQRLMRSVTNDNRNFRRHQINLPPEAWLYEPLDTFSWSSDRNGYVSKQFLNTGMDDLDNANQSVALLETDPTDYDWSPTFQLPWTVGPLTPKFPPSQPMYGWQVGPATINDSNGVPWRPSMFVSCAPDQTDVSNVWVQVRLAATGDIVFDSDSTRYGSPYSWVLNANFKGNTDYEARGRFVPFSGRATEWSAWLPVTTPNVLVTDLLVDLAHVKNDILNRFKELQAEIDDTRPLIEQLLVNTQSDSVIFDAAQRTLTATVGENKASFDEQIAVVADDISAAVAQTTEISAELADRFAEGLIKFAAAADQTGVNARFSIFLRAGVGDAYIESGMFLEIYTVSGVQKSRFSVLADQFSVLNPDNLGQSFLPVVVEGGVLKAQFANIGTVTAGLINGGPGAKMVIDITNGSITVSD
ncbi:phage tail protein [Rhizobium sp. CNPSo 3968]|uniref:phage tail tip fiber protein n=1 Tax=Rhizobium sp. CNPSo 3968 TaxID=3021408 RepID=UPI00254F1BFF|nr:DUF1983 domain-containing protein [Rhizobium sp. CNPSo 3968]MDK4720140.1 phage tail protein [Rhizobium sp. CNPSo 3968]